ncbi:TIGR04282 family arsenosugar biosynthesis glycosyltransferase [Dactylosporangium sp. CA-092794]|uniref:TIGR04282 family arsenosugar biosynthesis glycosyltransferase n=1 Tax=Dactylosporangium sp. CA-092794 TaxID=3239929 RepID=UPI003D8F672D
MSAPRIQLLLLAKAPVPGRVKTRLCPPWTPEQAARLAAAAIADTVDVLAATPAVARTLVVDGPLPAPPGWHRREQRGDGLGPRLASAFADTARRGVATLLVGMDTPQLGVAHLVAAAAALSRADAVLGPAEDGGWWTLALRDPSAATVLTDVPMSTPDTYALTRSALHRRGLRVATAATLRDVDTAPDATAAAAARPDTRFAALLSTMAPVGAAR